ncbi:uncharacterized protein AMSG_00093 [Thecamonas trahens ATCC 50062]|uniref:Uncharacterized protein n=1 Tax=Thecamonas trahens ATCC 50062 TaxID=461836 RepID=A0A0L0D172_THETB|nr:hypothetical protein AMSG_00093 [Thecamonas trahens ATCC 50062]KNC45976.1 hypothetical protein AMSG_00093 [Thecamonas trahens ATCC 50062]|eukprot:XP_013762957.1 hypothetical protein AMSG_00093 [Thecamonas trahens ATCC 50062]
MVVCGTMLMKEHVRGSVGLVSPQIIMSASTEVSDETNRPKRGRDDTVDDDGRAPKKAKTTGAGQGQIVRVVGDWLPDGELELTLDEEDGERAFAVIRELLSRHYLAGRTVEGPVALNDHLVSPFIAFVTDLPACLEPLAAAAQAWVAAASGEAILRRLVRGREAEPAPMTMEWLLRGIFLPRKGSATMDGMAAELRAWPAEQRDELFARLLDRDPVCARLTHAFVDPTVNFPVVAAETLNSRVVSCGSGKATVYVCVGDLVTGVGEAVTDIHTAETLENTIREKYDDLAPLLWQKKKRSKDLPSSPSDVFRLVPPLNDVAAERLPIAAPLFAAAVAAKVANLADAFAGAPTVLVAGPDEADALCASLVVYFSAVFGPCFVGAGVDAPGASSLVHARIKALTGAPSHVWRIVVLAPAAMFTVASMIPPHLHTSADLLVLTAADEWETNHADEARISGLDSGARAILDVLAGGSEWVGPGRVPSAKLKLGITGKGARSRTVDVFCHYTGATPASPAALALDLPDLHDARATFCHVTGISDGIFGASS